MKYPPPYPPRDQVEAIMLASAITDRARRRAKPPAFTGLYYPHPGFVVGAPWTMPVVWPMARRATANRN